MKDFEMNLRDDKEYNRWVEENREKMEVEALEHRQLKKIEMEMAREEAIEAREKKAKANQVQATKIKIEGEQKLLGLEKEKQEDLEVKKEIVDLVHDQRGVAAEKV